jgi:hypothetical protein
MLSFHALGQRHRPTLISYRSACLLVDMLISFLDGESKHPKRIIRPCTTHLLQEPWGRRPRQLAPPSALLKVPPTRTCEIIVGMVAGDRNISSPLDAVSYEAADVDLHEVWEDTSHTLTPTSEGVKRITWTYPDGHSPRRLRKSFYTGMVDAVQCCCRSYGIWLERWSGLR